MSLDLEKIMEEWAIEGKIPTHQLDETARQTPSLHAKYLKLRQLARLKLDDLKHLQKILLKEKWLYYNGKMDEKTLKDKGWEPDPFNGLRILKGEMDYYYDSDPEIIASEKKIKYYESVDETLTEILEHIKWRHQNIKNVIEWRKFEAGA